MVFVVADEMAVGVQRMVDLAGHVQYYYHPDTYLGPRAAGNSEFLQFCVSCLSESRAEKRRDERKGRRRRRRRRGSGLR